MQMERTQLKERCEGKLRVALGVPLAGETIEQLDRIGEQDRLRAEQGLVPIMGEGGKITYKHIHDLTRVDMRFRTAAEWVTVECGSASVWSATGRARTRLLYLSL